MTPLPPDPTQAIRARLEAATQGKWEAERDGDLLYVRVGTEAVALLAKKDSGVVGTEDDADFIAHAPEDIAALLALVDAAREEADELRKALRATVAHVCHHKSNDTQSMRNVVARARALLGGETRAAEPQNRTSAKQEEK